MNDVLFWLLIVAAVLAVQGTEPPPGQEKPPPPPPPLTGELARRMRGPGGGGAVIARWLMAAAATMMVAVGLLDLAQGFAPGSGIDRNRQLAAGALQSVAGLACLGLFYVGTARVPGLRALRDRAPISWLALLLFFESLAINLAPSTGVATVAGTVQPSAGPSAEDLMLGAVPFLVIGIAGVGPGVRRNLGQAAERLGLWPLRLPWWVVGLALGVLLVPVGDHVADWLNHLTSVQCLQQQLRVEQAITGTARTTLEQIGVAVAAGVCEETLFRGALQPRFGILLSSALWASYHLQYTCNGLPSASNLYILLLGLVFGVLRKRGGLMAAIVAHTAYDGVILLGLL